MGWFRVVAAGMAIAWAGASASPAAAAQTPVNPMIDIAYVEPANPDFAPLYEGLKRRKVLEELQAFLAPLLLPKRLTIEVAQCDAPNRLYAPGGPVTICYEYVARLRALAEKIPADGATDSGVTRDDAIIGAFVQATLQRTASAIIDIFDLPVWGREEDAADKLAAFLMLQFGPDAAARLIKGAEFFFNASEHAWNGADFAEIESPEAQRYYNYVCIAVGADPRTFAAGGESRDKPRSAAPGLGGVFTQYRAVKCAHEYAEERWAFQKLLLPHVDPVLLRQVLARDWLKPFDP